MNNQLPPPYHTPETFDFDINEEVKRLQELKELQKLKNELELEKKEKQRLCDIEELHILFGRTGKLQFVGDEIILLDINQYLLTDKKLYYGSYSYEKGVSNMGILYDFNKPISKETAPQFWYDGGTVPFLMKNVDEKIIEEYIRLIPGTYKNGKWRQIGGFFGLYINDEMKKIFTKRPPPLYMT